MTKINFGIVALACACLGANPAVAETLTDAIETAFVSNPGLAAQRQASEVAQEGLTQARAARRPTVELSGSAGYETTDSNQAFSELSTGDFPKASAQLQASLPIYTGGQIKAGIRQAEAGIGVADAQLEGVRQDLILQVVTAYVDVLRDREALTIRENSVNLLREQVRASQDRFDVGEVTRTDVAQSEARLEGSLAALAGGQAVLEGSLASYTFLVGTEPGMLVPVPDAPILPGSFEEALRIGLENNPNLEVLRYNERAAEQAVRAAQGALRPSVSIVGTAAAQETYGIDGTVNPLTQFALPDSFRDTSVSLFAQGSVPLYQGGANSSALRSAKLQREQARFLTLNSERQIRAQLAQAWFGNIAANRAIGASARQVEAAEIAYEGAQAELAVGVRTTLDVLDQEQQLLEARLNLIQAERDAYVAAHQLLRAMGTLSQERLDVSAPIEDIEG